MRNYTTAAHIINGRRRRWRRWRRRRRRREESRLAAIDSNAVFRRGGR